MITAPRAIPSSFPRTGASRYGRGTTTQTAPTQRQYCKPIHTDEEDVETAKHEVIERLRQRHVVACNDESYKLASEVGEAMLAGGGDEDVDTSDAADTQPTYVPVFVQRLRSNVVQRLR